jgi:hypothetical protein
VPATGGPRVCPQCGYSHLRPSRAHTSAERFQAWWSRTEWFRCDTCHWRGRLTDEWKPSQAFPDLPALRLDKDLNVDPLQQRDEDALTALVLQQSEQLRGTLKVWLDDSRPAPSGWLRVTTVRNARKLVEAGLVHEISLDYDLGWCADCLAREEHLKSSGRRHCEHTPTGYDLVAWMAETGRWPAAPPHVHSGNVEGGARMLGVIARYWHDGALAASPMPAADGEMAPVESAEIEHTPPVPHPDAASVAMLTKCPKCHGPFLYRTHRQSAFQRLRSMVTRRYPVRCRACGYTAWSADPILVRLSSSATGETGGDERLENSRFDDFDPD